MNRVSLSHVQQLALAALIVAAGGWYWSARSSQPALQAVNGTYQNPCCATVQLRDGFLISGTTRVSFRLENMKFGLTAYPATPVEVSGGQVTARRNASTEAILFSDDGTAFTLCDAGGCVNEYLFTRS